MPSNRVQSFYQQRANLYQLFFVRFLGWEEVLETFFSTHALLRPGMRILDAGCGTGSVTKALYRLARRQGLEDVHFYGFDLTPAMLALFQQWVDAEGAQGVHLRQADVLRLRDQLPGDWRDFDWIVSSAMLEYIPEADRDQALRNLRGRLNEDGRLLLFLTRRTWITRWTGARWWGTNLFDPDEITADLKRSGYTGVEWKQMPRGWDSFMMAVEAGAGTQV